MDKLIDYICDELDELEHKVDKDGKLSMSEIQYVDVLAHAKKNLLKTEEMDGGYSMRGEGNSYARGRGRNAKRDSMGRYSRRYSMDRSDMVDELRTMMDTAPDDRTRMELEKMISKIER